MTTFPGRTPSVNAVGEVERGHWTTQYDRVDAARNLPVGIRPFAVQFHYVREGDGVRVRISALMDQSARDVLPIETMIVRPGEPVVAATLAPLGVPAPELAVVPVSPTSFQVPEILNRALGLQVTVDLVPADVPLYRMRLTNTTAKAARAVHVTTFGPTGRLSATGNRRGPKGAMLMRPGASFTFEVRSLSLASNVMPLRARPLGGIVIDAVVWADGSHDGDPVPAARELVYQAGASQQLARVLAILEGGPTGRGQTAAEMLDRIRTELGALGTVPEPSDVRHVAARVPATPQFGAREVQASLRAARGHVLAHAMADVRDFRESRAEGELTVSEVAAWIESRVVDYRAWLERLSAV